MEKGDIVWVKGRLAFYNSTIYNSEHTYTQRRAHRLNMAMDPVPAVFLGWSFRAEGNIWYESDYGPEFRKTKRIRVAMVQQIRTQRYSIPWAVLPEDLITEDIYG